MSLVTLEDKQRALALIDGRSPAKDRQLLSLAQQTAWTSNQRALVERLDRARITQACESRRGDG